MKGRKEMVPFLTVRKGDEVLDSINLEGRDTLVMGRHHSCDLVVSHASSSRRHLEIQIISSTRDVILTDLGSVHGTWVPGNRLGIMTPVVVHGSATFQLGASTRVYRIDWQPVPVDSKAQAGQSAESIHSSIEAGAQEVPSHAPGKRQSGNQKRQASENQEFSSKSNSAGGGGHQSRGDKALFSSRQDENLSPSVLNSPGKFGHLQRAASSPKLPMRRLAFSSLQPSNKQQQQQQVGSPRSPSVKKAFGGRSSAQANKPAPVEKALPSPSKQQHQSGAAEIFTPSKLWLRRCTSAPLPALTTTGPNPGSESTKIVPSAPPLSALVEEQQEAHKGDSISGIKSSAAAAAAAVKAKKKALKFELDEDEEYPSDKENWVPVRLPSNPALKSDDCLSESHGRAVPKESSSSLIESIERQPFRPLFPPLPCASLGYKSVFQSSADSYVSSEEDFNCRALSLPRPQHKLCPTGENLDQLLRRLKLADSIEGRKQWHAVIDTNCLLDFESLKALKQLEGIKEVSVIIPKIVVRELDFLKHREGLRSPAREALRWIESCMVRLPNWIHVQKSSETLPAGATPPPSPSRPFPQHGDLMSPTSDDHILECAMLFDMTTHYGKVALLTRDTALRIKAMSEGLLSESAIEFVESLLSPYSNRFLWAGSTAHGKTWVDSPLHSPVSYPGEAARPKTLAQINHPVEELRNHISAQPRGLQVVVSQ
ncbi:hypothetical protein Mapa_008662 [Marchantia paleacea]|nr:hypothetical protein Mapa_008662 [Marchantia paleacea]